MAIKVEIIGHTLCIFRKKTAYFIRLCLSIDGRFEFKGEILPWFKSKEFDGHTAKIYIYAIPYLCVGKSYLK